MESSNHKGGLSGGRLRTVRRILWVNHMGVFFALSILAVSLSVSSLFGTNVTAAAPSTLNFQARLLTSSGSIVQDGTYNVEFKLYKASTSTGSSQGSCTGDSNCLWTETRTSGNKVTVKAGYLNVYLGDVTSLPSNVWDQQLWLTMNIGGVGSPSWDGEMTPRLRLTAVPYAFQAARATTLAKTSGANTGTLDFSTVANNPAITLPDASGTVCLTTGNCSGVGGTGDILQNGNSFGSTLTLGTNDTNNFAFETDGTTRAIINTIGDFLLGTSDATGNLLVLDTKTSAGDPTGQNGGMYYNSNLSKFRCYQNGAWVDCIQSGGSSGVTSVGTINSQTKSADGAVISGTVIYFQTADASNPGLVSTGAQTLAGAKTFTSGVTFSGVATDITTGTNEDLTVVANGTGVINLNDSVTVASGLTVTSGGATISAGGISVVGSSTIATTAGNTLGLGNSTGLVSITSAAGNVFNINGVIVNDVEFNRLDGKDAALVDTNDAVTTAITGTGALASGSIASGFGTISTGNTITTTSTVTGATINATSGYNLNGVQVTSAILSNDSNLAKLNGTQTFSGVNTFTGNVDVGTAAVFSTKAGATYTTAGSANNVALNTASLFRLDTAGAAQTITGIAAGRDGQQLTLINTDAAANVTFSNNSGSSSAGNLIITGTGADITLAPGASIDLIYDNTGTAATSFWRVVGGVASTGGSGANTALSNLASVNIGTTALNSTSNNLNLTTTTSGNIVLNSAGTIELQDNTNVTGAFSASTTVTAGTGLTVTTGGASITGTTNINNTGSSTTTIGNASAGAIALQSASTIGITGTTTVSGLSTGDALTVNNTTSTGNILVLQDGGTQVLTVADGGLATFTNTADNANAYQFRKSNGTVVFAIDTVNNQIGTPATTGAPNSQNLIVRTGAATGTGATGDITIRSGNSTASSSGNVSIEIGSAGTTFGTISIGAANRAAAVNIGSVGTTAIVSNINIANSTAAGQAQTVNIGSFANASSATTIQGATLGLNNGTSTGTTTIGNSAAGAISLQSGTGNISLTTNTASTGVVVRSATNSTSAFSVQNSANVPLLTADTVNTQVSVSGGLDTPYGGLGNVGNLLACSEAFDGGIFCSSWTATNTTVTPDDGASNPSPIGTTAADKIVSTVAGGNINNTYATATTGTYTFSLWLKTNSGTQNVDLRIDSTGTNAQTGTVKTVQATTSWQRFFVTQSITGPSITGIVARVFPGQTTGTGTAVIWGTQLVTGSAMQQYTYSGTVGTTMGTGFVSQGQRFVVSNLSAGVDSFVVRDPLGANRLSVDTTNGRVNLGSGGVVAGKLGFFQSASFNSNVLVLDAPTITAATRTISLPDLDGTLLVLQSSTPGTQQTGHLNISGTALAGQLKAQSTNASALQVSTAGGLQGFAVDTSAGTTALVQVGSQSNVNGQLRFANVASGAQTVTLQLGTVSAGYSLTLPTTLGASGDCLKDTTGTGVLGFSSCGGASATLQASYNSDTDGGDSIIALTTADDSIILRNPAASGTDSTYILTLDQLATGAKGGLSIQSAGTGNLLLVTDTTATARDVLTIADGGVTTFRSQTDNASAFQVQNAAGTNVINVDTTTSELSVRNLTDAGSLGAELATGMTCTGANWTGTGPWTHTSGSTSNLSCSVVPTAGVTYQITLTTASVSAGQTVRPNIGGTSGMLIGESGTFTTFITAGAATAFSITPSSTTNAVVSAISIKAVSFATSALSVRDSSNVERLEVRGTTNVTALGVDAGRSNSTGTNIVAVGNSALESNITGSFNTAVGDFALQNNTTGDGNTALGYNALASSLTGLDNTAVGYQALRLTTTGGRNVAVGQNALQDNTIGDGNVAIGYASGRGIVTGSNNIAIGLQAGYIDTDNFITPTSVSGSVAIGERAQVQASDSIVLGPTGSNTVNVGIGTTIPLNTLSVSPVNYRTGTASRSGSTVTGVGTTWTSDMVGLQFIFADGTTGTITGFTSATVLTLSTSGTVASQNYRIHNTGLQVASDGSAYVGKTSSTAFQVRDNSGYAHLSVGTLNYFNSINSNLITNPSFEGVGTTGWATIGTGVTNSTTSSSSLVYTGTTAWDLSTTSGGSTNQGGKYNITLTPSTAYVLIFHVQSSTLLTDLAAGYNNGTTDTTCTTALSNVPANGWYEWECSFTTPATNSGTPYVFVRQGAAATRHIYLDGMALIASAGSRGFTYSDGGEIKFNGIVTTDIISTTTTNSSTAFMIQTASGAQTFNVNTLLSLVSTHGNFLVGSNDFDSAAALYVDNTNNQVGIGTLSPDGKLDVNVGSSASTEIAGVFQGNVSGGSATSLGVIIRNTNSTSAKAAIYFQDNTLSSLWSVGVDAGGNHTNNFGIWNYNLSEYGFNMLTNGDADINGDLEVDLNGTVTTNGVCHSGGDVDVANTAVDRALVVCSAAPNDYAEFYPAELGVEAGDIVATTPNMLTYEAQGADAETGTVFSMGTKQVSILKKATLGDNAIGFISTAPYQTIGKDIPTSANRKPVALSGRVPVKVNNEGGAILPGDLISLSSVPGVATKAHLTGKTFGVALEAFSGTTGTIQVFVESNYYSAPITDALQGSSLTINGNAVISGDVSVGGNLNIGGAATLSSLHVTGNATFDGNITVVGSIVTKNITVNGHIITAGNTPTVTALTAAGQGALVLVEGNDTSGTIKVTVGAGQDVTAGDLVNIDFAEDFGKTPRVIMSADDGASIGVGGFASSKTSTGFKLTTNATPAANVTYSFTYYIVE